jgi:hypothetical protein
LRIPLPWKCSRRSGRTIWAEVAGRFERPCLMCAEKTPEQCHRRLLGEALVGGDAAELRHL